MSQDNSKECCIINYVKYYPYYKDDTIDYVAIYKLYVDPKLRGIGEARRLMDAAIKDIGIKFPGVTIKIEAIPYGDIGLNKEQLIKFYSSYDIEII